MHPRTETRRRCVESVCQIRVARKYSSSGKYLNVQGPISGLVKRLVLVRHFVHMRESASNISSAEWRSEMVALTVDDSDTCERSGQMRVIVLSQNSAPDKSHKNIDAGNHVVTIVNILTIRHWAISSLPQQPSSFIVVCPGHQLGQTISSLYSFDIGLFWTAEP